MRSLVAFTCAVVQALVYYVIAVVYSLIAILIAELIWNSKDSGVYLLWGLSFASYAVPKLVDQSFEKFKDAHAVMKETREVCIPCLQRMVTCTILLEHILPVLL